LELGWLDWGNSDLNGRSWNLPGLQPDLIFHLSGKTRAPLTTAWLYAAAHNAVIAVKPILGEDTLVALARERIGEGSDAI